MSENQKDGLTLTFGKPRNNLRKALFFLEKSVKLIYIDVLANRTLVKSSNTPETFGWFGKIV